METPTNTATLQQKEIIDLIEEALNRRVKQTIQQYADKNVRAFQANKIAGVEWKLQINVLVDNLGLLSRETKPPLLKRFIDFFIHLWPKAVNNQELGDRKAQ